MSELPRVNVALLVLYISSPNSLSELFGSNTALLLIDSSIFLSVKSSKYSVSMINFPVASS